jgi:hypothetical protein
VTAQLRHDVLRRDHGCARSAWGCGLVLEADGGDPGLLVIARADDVDGVAVTGINDRADSSITLDDMPKCSQLLAPSHGENRGSSPLGSANDFKHITAIKRPWIPRISNFSPMDGCFRSQFEVNLCVDADAAPMISGNDDTARGSTFATRISASRFAKSLRMIRRRARLGCGGGILFSLRSCRRVCRRIGSHHAEARRNRSPRHLRGTMPRAPYLPE